MQSHEVRAPTTELPTGGQTVAGTAGISQSGATMTITQTTNLASINWNTFNVGSAATVNFVQPSASSATLNRVSDPNPSQIFGRINANGQVFLSNASGIYFAPSASVNVGALTATTHSISDADFMAGNYRFTRDGATGAVINEGNLTAELGGYIALLAPEVRNQGVVIANMGTVALAAGETFDLQIVGNTTLANISVSASTITALVENGNAVKAPGGLIILSAQAASNLQSGVVNNSGVLEATGFTNNGGVIRLEATQALVQSGTLTAPTITVNTKNSIDSGTWDASAASNGTSNGGSITVTASGSVEQVSAAHMKAGASTGNAGSIKLTAAEGVYLSGNFDASSTGGQGGEIAITAPDITLAGTQLHADGTTGGGRIRIGGGWQGLDTDLANANTTRINASTNLTANATQQGTGGTVVVWSEQETNFAGHIEAKGGAQGGDGGQVEISSHGNLGFGGTVETPAAVGMGGSNGTLLLDPKNITITLVDNAPKTSNIQLTYIGANATDVQGSGYIRELSTGNIVVASTTDDRVATDAGAVRLYKPDGTLLSTITGAATLDGTGMTLNYLTGNGNYVVMWKSYGANGTPANAKGAATWVNGTTGAMADGSFAGPISSANSLVGAAAGDQVGTNPTGYATFNALANGNYFILTPQWTYSAVTNRGMGAITWGSGTAGVAGAIGSSNSLVGSHANDQVGYLTITALKNNGVDTGNYVFRAPTWNNDNSSASTTTGMGAVTWFNGANGKLADNTSAGVVSVANSLIGSNALDQVGSSILALTNGNYVVSSTSFKNGAAGTAGAATWGNGATGTAGAVDVSNSLVGSTSGDNVGTSLNALTNGNYVVQSSNWDLDGTHTNVGAITWGDGSTGGTRLTGAVSASNSLVGSTTADAVGSGSILLLANGNYVQASTLWDNPTGAIVDAGAVTWVNGSNGYIGGSSSTGGAIDANNSLIGNQASSKVGEYLLALTGNNNYVVTSPNWGTGVLGAVGAVTWGDGATGKLADNTSGGVVSALNSMVGSKTNDKLGYTTTGATSSIKALSNGNYVFSSPTWDNSTIVDAGAATWGNGATGSVGVVSSSNSLVGTTAGDNVGQYITVIPNGNYLVGSSIWNGGRGALSWGDGSTSGTRLTGAVSASNSLVGGAASDYVGTTGSLTLLGNNYVVNNQGWGSGGVGNAGLGAVTWGSGTAGVAGVVSASNSLVGSTAGDRVGYSLSRLGNNNYVVKSQYWGSGDTTTTNGKGAVTWGSGTAGVTGVVSSSNSLVGSTAGDLIGNVVTALTNNSNYNYVVSSTTWDLDATHTNVGAYTFGSGTAVLTGVVSASNSLIGSTTGDGTSSGLTTLTNGNYVVRFSNWDNGTTVDAGAVAWGGGTSGVVGAVSDSNSVVGDSTGYKVGSSVVALTNGNYLIQSPNWGSTGSSTTNGLGAFTIGIGATGSAGIVTSGNSLVGTTAGDLLGSGAGTALTVGSLTDSAVVRSAGFSSSLGRVDIIRPGTGGAAGALTNPQTYAMTPSSNSTITAAQITDLLNAGTNVSLQANNDITVNTAITANNPSGNGGALTMEAGRSMLINADITTDNGNLTLKTNTRSRLTASSVYSANRDAGTGVFTMAAGTTLNAGTGNVVIAANNQSDASSSGSLTLASIIANTIKVTNNFNMPSSRVVIRSGSVLNASATSGDSIRLETGYGFTNQAGSGAMVVNNTGGNTGRWLVFTESPSTNNTVKDGLTSDFRRYNLNYWTTPSPALPSGNGFVYNSGQGSLFLNTTLTGGTASQVYGDTPTATFGYNFKYTDLEDTAPTVSGTAGISFTGATPSATLGFGTYNIRYGTTGLTAANGSTIALGSAVAGYSVTKRPLVVTGTKVYDNSRTVAASALTVSNRIGSDVITLTGSIANATADDHVGSNLVLSNLSGSVGISNTNYTFTGGSGTINVTPKPLTLLSLTAANKTYDGTTTATISAGTLPGVITPTATDGKFYTADTVTFNATGATANFADKNVGTGKTVTASGGSLSGADAGDYTLSSARPTTTANITTKQLTLAGSSGISKTYDGTTAMGCV